MSHAHTQRLIAAWRLSRGERRLPARAELTPEVLGPLLPQVFILGDRSVDAAAGDAAGDADWRFRLAGGFVNDLHGRELRGEVFLDLWRPADRADVLAALERARTGAEPVVLKAWASAGEARTLGLELTLAPATGPTEAADRVLGLVQPTGMVARLEGRPALELRLAGREIVPPPTPRLVVDNTRP